MDKAFRLKFVLFFFLFVAACLLWNSGTASAVERPLDIIRSGSDRVLALVRTNCNPGQPLPIYAHREEIRAIVDDYFDFEESAKRSLGRQWKQQSPENQKEFVSLFEQLLFNTYLDQASEYSCPQGSSKESVLYDGEQVEGEYALVKTRVSGYKATDVAVEYRMHLKNNQWMVYDVVIQGISMVNNYRSQFDSILSSNSFDSLVKQIRQKVSSKSGQDKKTL